MVSHATTFGQAHPETLIEWTRQPLFWNPQVRTSDGTMLGQLKGLVWGKLVHTRLHHIGDWRCLMAPWGTHEDPSPPLKGAMKMRRLIAKAVGRVPNELQYLGKARARALGTQSEWWRRLVTTGRQTRRLLRWNPNGSCGSTFVVPTRN